MSEMVERVARIIANSRREEFGGAVAIVEWDRSLARAAIEAMREPSKEMLMAAGLNGGQTVKGKWNAMITEALK